jgi:hypothetical protein
MKKKILLASFVKSGDLDNFISKLGSQYNINIKDIFCYKMMETPDTHILTYKLFLSPTDRFNFKNELNNAIPIHKHGDTLYTINALNKLISNIGDENYGNVDNSKIVIDWSKYQNNIILTSKGNLSISPISRIF